MLKSSRYDTALPGPARSGRSLGAACLSLRTIMPNFKIVSSYEERGNEAFP